MGINQAARIRLNKINNTEKAARDEFEQHLTPPETAVLAASLFSDTTAPISCLDLGCGTGILSAAVTNRYSNNIVSITGIDIDDSLENAFYDSLIGVNCSFTKADALELDICSKYTHVILNPPYKKMGRDDSRRKLLPVSTPNLYSAFIVKAIQSLKPNGECVAIVPRSWMNGDYFKDFRKWMYSNASLEHIHVYGSRSTIFSDTNVLQETMIVKFSKRQQSDVVCVTQSQDRDSDIEEHSYPFVDIVSGSEFITRISPIDSQLKNLCTLPELNITPSTGKVVDFRMRSNLIFDAPEVEKVVTCFPLVYPVNFSNGEVVHPVYGQKAQFFNAESTEEKRSLIPSGIYVLVKRFTSKEEKRRIVAAVLDTKQEVAVENHLNVLHIGTSRKVVPFNSIELARGLSMWLNSSQIDQWFRDVSGSTQVNAKDLKVLPCPSKEKLAQFGARWKCKLDQVEIDNIVEDK